MKRSSLTIKTLTYIGIFASVIIILLYILQIQFLQNFYEKLTIDNLKSVATNIKEENDNIDELLNNYAIQEDMCIEYYTKNSIIEYNTKNRTCILGIDNEKINNYKNDLIKKKKDYVEVYLGDTKKKSIIYAIDLDNNEYIFINKSLRNIDTTTFLLKKQLIILLIVLLTVSILLAIFITKKLNKPILSLIASAKELEKGNYNVKFSKSNVAELDELSDVLTVAASEMNKTDKLQKDLIANVSHDLKTPLTMIKAYAEKIKDISYKDHKKMEKDLDVIIEETDRLNALVNDLLDLSKLEKGKSLLNIEEYDLVEDINNILKRYDIIVEKDHYKIDVNMPKSLIVKADKQKIEQVIYNLINNAIEHASDDLTIYIKVKKEIDGIRVSITNHGVGLTEEEKALVWKRFYKKDKNHKRNVVGSGIGLSIVKEILKAHNFEYGIDSKLNEFTTFYFKIKKKK